MPDKITTMQVPYCPVCGDCGLVRYSNVLDLLFGAEGSWSISKCKNNSCGILWLNPRPIREDIYKAYRTYYTHESASKLSIIRHFKVLLLRIIIKLATLFMSLSREKFELSSLYLHGATPGRLLEVGCGNGYYLDYMKKKGWAVDGLDFDPMAATAALKKYGIPITIGSIEESSYSDDTFDAIIMKHVIEHVYDPISTINIAFRKLKIGGRLIVITPNAESYGLHKFGKYWRGLEPPRHIHIFSSRSLETIAKRAGFSEAFVHTTAANAWTILMSSIKLLGVRNSRINKIIKSPFRLLIYALKYQYEEAKANKKLLNVGEECILQATK
jgi:2-polyprenyl-3-methyl-5-hydroxy-6-metoxy-1,4-benzoquinol methylase